MSAPLDVNLHLSSRRTLAVAAFTIVLTSCGSAGDETADDAPAGQTPVVHDPGPVHVHGLGENPKDGALFVATHTGLFRIEHPGADAERIADRYQDTMGFTVVGPDHFFGSGHPDGRDGRPPFLGLIESTDAGESWRPVSLEGAADFHVLEAGPRQGNRFVYGYGAEWETRSSQFLVSEDGGRSWAKHPEPEPLMSLAIDPADMHRIVAAGNSGLHSSSDAGLTWRPLSGPRGLLSWSDANGLFVVTPDGWVYWAGTEPGRWTKLSSVGGEPAAFETAGRDVLYVALHDGTIKRSTDAGRSWTVFHRPT